MIRETIQQLADKYAVTKFTGKSSTTRMCREVARAALAAGAKAQIDIEMARLDGEEGDNQ